MKRYNIINNTLGWLCFIIAATTYLLTLEPTASFWDCPEFILQAFKLEVGHPPGNPIFMLAARFFITLVGGNIDKVALMVNAMSGLLSAGTILLLFWTITHLVKRLIVHDDATDISIPKMLVIFGSGICGAMMYAWSDTFWFSAVEGEVYAFSSFCTALVFWLILKWENRADRPHSDKYLIFIAYIIGISIAVHLLNLLCIPAIVLVVYYKKWHETTAKGSLIALLISFAIVGLILYGLVPGFIEVSQYFELFAVNACGLPFNVGVLIYAAILVASLIWTIRCLYKQQSPTLIRISFMLSVLLSGIPFIGDNLIVPVLFMAALAVYLFIFCKKIPVRILNLITISILVIFIGYSSYALLLIRSSAHTPMNQNAPDNVFSLSSYLNREQYGDRPLFYGETLNSSPVYTVLEDGSTKPVINEGHALYARQIKKSADEPDRYILTGHKKQYQMMPELDMLFPRIYSGAHQQAYADWIGEPDGVVQGKPVSTVQYRFTDGTPYEQITRIKPTMNENLTFLVTYQLNHMYWRYFMWNFAGRQNDIQGNGEINHGNWISGIPFIDNPRLGDQSLLPDELGKDNAGHNVFFLIPLLMGIIGLLWQAFTSKRGIEQFWVVFFLFFMTGIAIVLYLNQTPTQPRERDYAFAGSFYAYAIWVGIGVAGIWRAIITLFTDKKLRNEAVDDSLPTSKAGKLSLIAAVIAAVIAIAVPLQVVSQTWDDHDRSGRYTARDFGENYLQSLDPDAIIFTNGDNDTFPLWYAQEVEGTRTDVKVVNLSYLTTDWYADQVRRPSYDAPGIAMQATSPDYAYDRLQFTYFYKPDSTRTTVQKSLAEVYAPGSEDLLGAPVLKHPNMYIPFSKEQLVKNGRITPQEAQEITDSALNINLLAKPEVMAQRGLRLSGLLSLDMLATSAANGWNRPIYFAMTVPDEFYLGLNANMRNTGLAYEITPVTNVSGNTEVNTDKMYRNVTERFRWGGLDKVTAPGQIYLDETVRRMVTTNRSAMLDLATSLYNEGIAARDSSNSKRAAQRFEMTRNILNLIRTKLPVEAMPYSLQIGQDIGELFVTLGKATGNNADVKQGLAILHDEAIRLGQHVRYYQSLSPRLYAALPNIDQVIDRYIFMSVLESYSTSGGDITPLLEELTAMGVDIERSQRLMEAVRAQ